MSTLVAPSAPVPPAPAAALERGNSLWHDAWLRLRKNRLAVFGAVTLIVVSLACFLGPFFSPYGYEDQNLDLGASAPSAQHWLGTDTLGPRLAGPTSLWRQSFPRRRSRRHRGGIDHRRRVRGGRGLLRRQTGCGHDAHRGHHVFPAVHHLRHPADGLFWS
jgi:hypothetical protein